MVSLEAPAKPSGGVRRVRRARIRRFVDGSVKALASRSSSRSSRSRRRWSPGAPVASMRRSASVCVLRAKGGRVWRWDWEDWGRGGEGGGGEKDWGEGFLWLLTQNAKLVQFCGEDKWFMFLRTGQNCVFLLGIQLRSHSQQATWNLKGGVRGICVFFLFWF